MAGFCLIILKTEKDLDFDDGIQLFSAKLHNATIITYDKDLLKQTTVKAIHPREYK